jgi:hypothetical protein
MQRELFDQWFGGKGNVMQPHSRQFGFHDLHSFKDYVGFVGLCAPDDFPVEDWAGPSDRWTLDLAYEGLLRGLEIAESEGVSKTILAECRSLFDTAFKHYRAGVLREGFKSMEAAQRILGRVPSQ